MSQDSSNPANKELRILHMVKKTLTEVAKDTQTAPGMRHPLSEQTIMSIRDCLGLIVARETELTEELGKARTVRPHFSDEPQDSVVVRFDPSGSAGKK